jgi:MFS family permease
VFALASVAGPLAGGWLVDNVDWRWVFYINVPIGLVALVVTGSALNLAFVRRDHPIDFAGAATLVVSVSALLLAMVWGGNEYDWNSPVIIGLLIVGLAVGAIFLWWERRATEPILPPRLFRNRTFALTSAAGFIVGVAMFGGIVFLPLFLQVVIGASATNSGLLLIPMMGGIIGSSVIGGRLITRTGRYKIFPVIGATLVTVAFFLLSTMTPQTVLATASVYMFLLGVGVGMIMPVLVLAVQNAVDHRDLGVATSSNNFFRSLGGAFGTALLGAVFTGQLTSRLAGLLPSVGADRLTSSPASIAALPEAVRTQVVDAFANSIGTVFLVALPFTGLALILALLTPELPLRETAHVGAAES